MPSHSLNHMPADNSEITLGDSRLTRGTFFRRDTLFVMLLSAGLCSHYLYYSDFPTEGEQWEGWQLLYVCSVAGLISMGRLSTMPFPRAAIPLLLPWVLFALARLVSAIHHDSDYGSALWLLIGIPLFLFNILPLLLHHRGNYLIACSFVAASTGLLSLSLVVEPIQWGLPYAGIFRDNTPTTAQVSAMMVIGALGLLNSSISQRTVNNAQCILLSLLLLAGLVMVFSTVYRTAIASCIITLIVFTAVNYRRTMRLMRLYAASTTLILAVLVSFELSGRAEQVRVWEPAVAKQQQRTAAEAGVWTYRQTEWQFAISNANLLGHGAEFAREQPVLSSWHSAFTLILGSYGIPAALFFTCFWIVSLIYAHRYVRVARDTDSCSSLPLLCTVFFLAYSLGAMLFGPWGSGPILGFLIALGTVIMREAVQYRDASRIPRVFAAKNEGR